MRKRIGYRNATIRSRKDRIAGREQQMWGSIEPERSTFSAAGPLVGRCRRSMITSFRTSLPVQRPSQKASIIKMSVRMVSNYEVQVMAYLI